MSNNIHKRCAEIMAELGKNGEFEFWEEFKWLPKQKLEKRLKDILENDVEDKYYLSDKMVEYVTTKAHLHQSANRIQDKEYSCCLNSTDYKCPPCIEETKIQDDYRIRKLTPRECFRLQDFDDTFKFVVSNSQLYKQAGNSISVNVSEMIFRQIEFSKGENMNKNSLF
tara:strand:- start:3260 stop:3763 length:504 start_codon:yes stop_codon:yes gene_type:complete